MDGWLFHRNDKAQWLLYLADGTRLSGPTRRATLIAGKRAGLTSYTRYAGRSRLSEIAMTVSELRQAGAIVRAEERNGAADD